MEFENLSVLLDELLPALSSETVVIIADDSGPENQNKIIKIIQSKTASSAAQVFLNFSPVKGGRGAAIRRGFKFGVENFVNAKYFIEMDADGSHTITDAIRILQSEDSEFTIGSRYLPESKIHGWPLTRRIFSRILNYLIPWLFKVQSTDLTNGLRRYNRESVNILLQEEQRHFGFIYLTEEAVVLNKNGIKPNELPINFGNRIYGDSSVGFKEIFNSVIGILSLLKSNR